MCSLPPEALRRVDQRLRILQQGFGLACRHEPALLPREQRHAQVFFELREQAADRGLRQAEPLRGARGGAGGHDGLEGFELLEVHGRHLGSLPAVQQVKRGPHRPMRLAHTVAAFDARSQNPPPFDNFDDEER